MGDEVEIPKELVEAYSRGEITRREIQDRLDEPVGFGLLLGHLHRYNLPLPRIPADPTSPGFELIRQLVRRNRHAG